MRYLFLVFILVDSLFISSIAQELSPVSDSNLKYCISEYRNGYYARTIECVDNVLPQLNNIQDSVESFKMLALSYGMINQIDKSKMYFSMVLEKDSAAEIDTLAFPPNIAIIFNQVKLEKKISQIKTDTIVQPSAIHKPKRSAAIPLLLSSVVVSSGSAVYLCYSGYIAYMDYSSLGRDQQGMMDKKWKEYAYYVAGGVGCAVVSGISTWLFFRTINKNSAVHVYGRGNGVLLVYDF